MGVNTVERSDSVALPPDVSAGPPTHPAEPSCYPWQPVKLSAKQIVMLEYHLAGHMHREIGKIFGYSEVQVGQIVRSELAQEYMRGRIDDLNGEFQGLFRKVIDVIDENLDNEDPEVALKAADKWLRAHGRYAPKKDANAAVTAEDVIAKLLEKRGDVTVNIDNRRQYSYRSEADAST